MHAWHRTACWTYAASMAKPSGSESSIPTNCSLMLPDSGKALFPWHWGHKWRNIIEMIICIKTQIWADISLALCNPKGCLGERRRGGLPVSLGWMINEARILGGPSPPPLRPRGRALHMKLAYAAHLPGREPLMILPTPLCFQSPKQHSKTMPDPGLAGTLFTRVAVREGWVVRSSISSPAPVSSTFHLNHIDVETFLLSWVGVIL